MDKKYITMILLLLVSYPSKSMLESIGFDNFRLGTTPQDRFFVDVYRDDTSAVNAQLANKEIAVDATNDAGDTALLIASGRSQKMVTLLLAYRANPNFVGKDGATPLLRALKNNLPTIATTLLPLTADFDKQDNSRNTALMYAALKQNKNAIVYLLNVDANIDIKNKEQETLKDILNRKPKLAQDPEIRKALAAYEERRKAKQQALQQHLPKDLANLSLEYL